MHEEMNVASGLIKDTTFHKDFTLFVLPGGYLFFKFFGSYHRTIPPTWDAINLLEISTNNTSSFTSLRNRQASSLTTSISLNSSLISVSKHSYIEQWELPHIKPQKVYKLKWSNYLLNFYRSPFSKYSLYLWWWTEPYQPTWQKSNWLG